MFILHLVFSLCTSLEKALLEQGDVENAIRLCGTKEGPLDYFYSYFVKKVFMGKSEEALLDIAGSDNYKDARNIVLGVMSMESGNTNERAKLGADLLWNVAVKVSRKYLRNPHAFLATDAFEKLEKNSLTKRGIGNIVTMVYSGDDISARLFLSLLDNRKIYIGDYIDVIEFLGRNGYGRALGYLGEIYYHGIGVKRSLDQAMYFFSKGKEMQDTVGACGVGKILMSSEYKDYKNAKSALSLANRLGQSGEAEYLMYLLMSRRPEYVHRAGPHMDSALMYGYLPAICRDGVNYYTNGQYINACIRFHPIMDYSDIVYDLRKRAEASFISRKYRQCVMALLMCVELGSVSSIRNAIYVLKRHYVFKRQEHLLFELYMKLLRKGDQDVINRIGDAYFYGSGVEKSYRDAFAFYISASLARDPEGCYNVSYMYEHGYGVKKSLLLAYKYILKIRSTDDMYLLLLYTHIRLFFKLIARLLLNRYSISICIGGLVVRRIYITKRAAPNEQETKKD
ncbi:hypothetical protein EROM_020940 [Encephalitozoon romaleae SJ-2008]|uniref:Uncharacterized protein n=1 Tax=Encephalitozoon romaleae (strain SJ-2008) TaxID=1178016 RepID=I7ALL8_ENCRO|nr:hypothetical protein EROM_020940 [Encephalitozoon romaleae SJ-2008]AFN82569.1 hypothetical protein EROM_020940 [Encephalitozoon romaleae SJ-2008]